MSTTDRTADTARTRALVWFRRDLRLADNPALQAALDAGHAPVPVYVHAPEEEGAGAAGASLHDAFSAPAAYAYTAKVAGFGERWPGSPGSRPVAAIPTLYRPSPFAQATRRPPTGPASSGTLPTSLLRRPNRCIYF